MVAWFLKGWTSESWPKEEPYRAIFVDGPAGQRFEVGLSWSDQNLVTADDAFKVLFQERLQGYGQGFRVLGSQPLGSRTQRYWAEQDRDRRRYLTQLTVQLSSNPPVTFGGKPRTFVAWRRERVPIDGDEVRNASLLEAMRLASILRPTL